MSHNIDDLLEEIEILKGYKHMYKKLNEQNKRYREYLELIKTTGTYGKDISTGEILRTYEANLADEALEGDLDE